MEQLFLVPRFGFVDQVGEELGSIGSKLIPNFFSFIVQLLALIVVIVIVMVFAYKPVKKNLDARSDFIEKEINSAKENNVLSEQNKIQSEQEIIAARKKASEIIANANQVAEAQKQEILANCEAKVASMKQEAEEDIKKAKQDAIDDIHNEIINVALDASKELLQREISEKDSQKFVDEFLKEIK